VKLCGFFQPKVILHYDAFGRRSEAKDESWLDEYTRYFQNSQYVAWLF
jgi:hypothetical protein